MPASVASWRSGASSRNQRVRPSSGADRLFDATRHAGHADILREQLDGSVGVESSNPPLHGRDMQFWNARRAALERIATAADQPNT